MKTPLENETRTITNVGGTIGAESEDTERRYEYVMRTKHCDGCRGSGIGRFVRMGNELEPMRCETCLGNGRVMVAEWTNARPQGEA